MYYFFSSRDDRKIKTVVFNLSGRMEGEEVIVEMTANAYDLIESINKQEQKPEGVIFIFDSKNLEHIDSCGLQAMINILKKLRIYFNVKKTKCIVINSSLTIETVWDFKKILEMTNLDTLFKICENMNDAYFCANEFKKVMVKYH